MDHLRVFAGALAAALVVGGSPPAAASTPPADEASPVDTTFAVARGTRLALRNYEGSLVVDTWSRDAVRTTAERSDRSGVQAWVENDRVIVGARDDKGRRLRHAVRVTVPAWMPVDLRGTRLDVAVTGLRASVSIRTVEGELTVRDVEGDVDLNSVDGEIFVSGVRGTVGARSVNDDVTIRAVRGDVEAQSTDGDVVVEDVDAMSLAVSALDGDVRFQGRLAADGEYSITTHSGDVTVVIPRGSGASVTVSTFDGSFEAEFPITVDRFTGGRETRFRVGDGAARLILQAFDGDIRLRYGR